MIKCLNCGKDTANGMLCNECMTNADIEKLCIELHAFNPDAINEEHPYWNDLANRLENPKNFRDSALSLCSLLPAEKRDYLNIILLTSAAAPFAILAKSRDFFLEKADKILAAGYLTDMQKSRLQGLKLNLLYSTHRYYEAEKIADILSCEKNLPWEAAYSLAEFYSRTVRFDKVQDIIERYQNTDELSAKCFEKLNNNYCDYQKRYKEKGRGYLPCKSDNIKLYIEFMRSLGYEIRSVPQRESIPDNKPPKIEKNDYPKTDFVDIPKSDTFVVYDLETTGLNTTYGAIIQIGAVKVVDGIIDESQTFEEFVNPKYSNAAVSEKITEKTGITNDEVKNARQIWEIIPDFVKFIGDDTLVGFNNKKFDSKFLERAGRYSNIIITNKQFDVMRYAKRISDKYNLEVKGNKLNDYAEYFGIKNEKAHTALSDAITTAKVYIELRKLEEDKKLSENDGLDLDW